MQNAPSQGKSNKVDGYIYIYIYANVSIGDPGVVLDTQYKKRLAAVTPNACMHLFFAQFVLLFTLPFRGFGQHSATYCFFNDLLLKFITLTLHGPSSEIASSPMKIGWPGRPTCARPAGPAGQAGMADRPGPIYILAGLTGPALHICWPGPRPAGQASMAGRPGPSIQITYNS